MPKARCIQGRQTTGIYTYYDEVRCRYCGKIQPTPMPPRPEKRNPFSEEAKRLSEKRRRRRQDSLFPDQPGQ